MKKGMIAKTDQKARVFSLQTSVSEMVLGGKRDAKEVADALQVIKDHRDFAKRLGLKNSPVISNDVKAKAMEWESLYKEVFGLDKDFSNLQISERKEGFDRLIIVAQGMTPNRIFNKLKELMKTWKYSDDLDSITSVRKTDQDYAIWVRDRAEADEELKNKSANDLQKEGVNSITLEERLLLEIKYFRETGKHLDVENITLCAGSRDAGGGVPGVYWDGWGGWLGVNWFGPGGACGGLRSRPVVS